MRRTLLSLIAAASLLGAGTAAASPVLHLTDTAVQPVQYYAYGPGYGAGYGGGEQAEAWHEREWRHREWERHRHWEEWHRWHDGRPGW